ncbi:metallophosphoesterase family protein [Carboxylicivirga mesophila]|uniref:Phosphoesterase n=1 Tax=Carboxylicivirga mesophila TaxID=1166478 RepID=A0ABS5K8J3_9BACT|nr:metallophosphoesterase family protein [Carboxylicivirga mesophila]MBS2210826.1 metallophosphoesterase family protein [Carboxylicivirga mesophila]
MTRIGLLSDTHSYLDERFKELFKDVDEIWHAGDIGDIRVLDQLRQLKPVRAVYGNIDGTDLRQELKAHERFMCEEVDVWMTHIGGYPGKYDSLIKGQIYAHPPKLFISGHSHILKVIYDKKLELLHLNPGACGISGFHSVRTALRFAIDGAAIKDMEVIELGPKAVK